MADSSSGDRESGGTSAARSILDSLLVDMLTLIESDDDPPEVEEQELVDCLQLADIKRFLSAKGFTATLAAFDQEEQSQRTRTLAEGASIAAEEDEPQEEEPSPLLLQLQKAKLWDQGRDSIQEVVNACSSLVAEEEGKEALQSSQKSTQDVQIQTDSRRIADAAVQAEDEAAPATSFLDALAPQGKDAKDPIEQATQTDLIAEESREKSEAPRIQVLKADVQTQTDPAEKESIGHMVAGGDETGSQAGLTMEIDKAPPGEKAVVPKLDASMQTSPELETPQQPLVGHVAVQTALSKVEAQTQTDPSEPLSSSKAPSAEIPKDSEERKAEARNLLARLTSALQSQHLCYSLRDVQPTNGRRPPATSNGVLANCHSSATSPSTSTHQTFSQFGTSSTTTVRPKNTFVSLLTHQMDIDDLDFSAVAARQEVSQRLANGQNGTVNGPRKEQEKEKRPSIMDIVPDYIKRKVTEKGKEPQPAQSTSIPEQTKITPTSAQSTEASTSRAAVPSAAPADPLDVQDSWAQDSSMMDDGPEMSQSPVLPPSLSTAQPARLHDTPDDWSDTRIDAGPIPSSLGGVHHTLPPRPAGPPASLPSKPSTSVPGISSALSVPRNHPSLTTATSMFNTSVSTLPPRPAPSTLPPNANSGSVSPVLPPPLRAGSPASGSGGRPQSSVPRGPSSLSGLSAKSIPTSAPVRIERPVVQSIDPRRAKAAIMKEREKAAAADSAKTRPASERAGNQPSASPAAIAASPPSSQSQQGQGSASQKPSVPPVAPKSALKAKCNTCGAYGHLASDCPSRPSSSGTSSAPAYISATMSSSSQRAATNGSSKNAAGLVPWGTVPLASYNSATTGLPARAKDPPPPGRTTPFPLDSPGSDSRPIRADEVSASTPYAKSPNKARTSAANGSSGRVSEEHEQNLRNKLKRQREDGQNGPATTSAKKRAVGASRGPSASSDSEETVHVAVSPDTQTLHARRSQQSPEAGQTGESPASNGKPIRSSSGFSLKIKLKPRSSTSGESSAPPKSGGRIVDLTLSDENEDGSDQEHSASTSWSRRPSSQTQRGPNAANGTSSQSADTRLDADHSFAVPRASQTNGQKGTYVLDQTDPDRVHAIALAILKNGKDQIKRLQAVEAGDATASNERSASPDPLAIGQASNAAKSMSMTTEGPQNNDDEDDLSLPPPLSAPTSRTKERSPVPPVAVPASLNSTATTLVISQEPAPPSQEPIAVSPTSTSQNVDTRPFASAQAATARLDSLPVQRTSSTSESEMRIPDSPRATSASSTPIPSQSTQPTTTVTSAQGVPRSASSAASQPKQTFKTATPSGSHLPRPVTVPAPSPVTKTLSQVFAESLANTPINSPSRKVGAASTAPTAKPTSTSGTPSKPEIAPSLQVTTDGGSQAGIGARLDVPRAKSPMRVVSSQSPEAEELALSTPVEADPPLPSQAPSTAQLSAPSPQAQSHSKGEQSVSTAPAPGVPNSTGEAARPNGRATASDFMEIDTNDVPAKNVALATSPNSDDESEDEEVAASLLTNTQVAETGPSGARDSSPDSSTKQAETQSAEKTQVETQITEADAPDTSPAAGSTALSQADSLEIVIGDQEVRDLSPGHSKVVSAAEIKQNGSSVLDRALEEPFTRCRFGIACLNLNCKFAHPSSAASRLSVEEKQALPKTALQCEVGVNCGVATCPRSHPSPAEARRELCKNQANCPYGIKCAFRHVDSPQTALARSSQQVGTSTSYNQTATFNSAPLVPNAAAPIHAHMTYHLQPPYPTQYQSSYQPPQLYGPFHPPPADTGANNATPTNYERLFSANWGR